MSFDLCQDVIVFLLGKKFEEILFDPHNGRDDVIRVLPRHPTVDLGLDQRVKEGKEHLWCVILHEGTKGPDCLSDLLNVQTEVTGTGHGRIESDSIGFVKKDDSQMAAGVIVLQPKAR